MPILDDLANELGMDPDDLRNTLLAGDEVLQPTYLTVDSAGKVSASFSGHVHGGGFDLDEASVSDIEGQPSGAVHSLSWLSGGNIVTQLLDQITAPDGVSRLSAWKKLGAAPAVVYEILGSDDTSDYLRFGNTHGGGANPGGGSTAKIEFGKTTVAFAAQALKTVQVNHNLGHAPTAVVATLQSPKSTLGYNIVETGNYTATQFDLYIEFAGNVTLNQDAAWIAIG